MMIAYFVKWDRKGLCFKLWKRFFVVDSREYFQKRVHPLLSNCIRTFISVYIRQKTSNKSVANNILLNRPLILYVSVHINNVRLNQGHGQ